MKNDNNEQAEAIQSKTKLINEFQQLIEISSDKYRLFEKTNTKLNKRLLTAERANESLTSVNVLQKDKIRELETKYNNIANDSTQKEESLNIKLSSVENQRSIDNKNH